MEEKRNSFSNSLGFVIAAAASAVGLGNIWRFPYLAARDGGGLFLVIYLILALTFGFTLVTAEIAIGRKTKQSPLTAYKTLNKNAGVLGVMACVIPSIILPYYCAIGGWVIRYFLAFLSGAGEQTAQEGYFSDFISETNMPIIMLIVFLVLTMIIVIGGVDKGIERFSKIILPVLLLFVIVIAVFSLTISYKAEDGTIRTGMEGLRILILPDLTGVDIKTFISTLIDAMGQLFYSLSIAMGILIAYGSYMRDDTDLEKSVRQIEIFDTGVAFLAGVMIIPAVYVFMGKEGMEASGPGLMFVTLPKVFRQMGGVGNVIGGLFFAMVLFAAVTSSVSIMEAVVSSFIDGFKMKRKKAVLLVGGITLLLGVLVCLGYNVFYFEYELPNGAVGQILDIMDYISNNLLMPAVSIATCILIGWIMGPGQILDEVSKNGENFRRKGLFIVMIRFVAPVMLLILLLKAVGL